MKALIDSIGRGLRRPAGTVVHIGAGTGAVIEDYRSLNPVRLLLLEGDPDSALALREHAAAEPAVEVFGEVVARRDMSLHWYRYTLASVNGPIDRSDLVRVYPRLRLLGTLPLKAVAFDRWLARTVGQLDDEHSHMLVMDVPGQEAALLQALPQALLERFEVVVLKGCAAPAPDGVVPAAFAEARLRERSFEVLPDKEDADPLWPVSVWRFDAQGAELKRLRARVLQLEELQQQADRAMSERDAALGTAQDSTAAAEKLAADRAAAIETLQRRLDEQSSALQARILQLGELQQQADRAMNERDTALGAAQDSIAAVEKLAADRAAAIEVLQRQLDEQNSMAKADAASAKDAASERERQLTAVQRERDAAHAELAAARQRLLALEDELRTSQRALSAAVRMQALRESDLHDLQERYSALMRDQRGTQELLAKLTDRLVVAHRYYEELALAPGQESMPSTLTAQEGVQVRVETER